MLVKKCIICKGSTLDTVIDLGFHPLADTFLKKEKLRMPEERYPLFLILCKTCGHLQRGYTVDKKVRYQGSDYSYDSSNSRVAIAHFESMAHEGIAAWNIGKGDLVLDIGSNVGTLLLKFKQHSGAKILGIEPSKNITRLAKKEGVPTLNRFFDTEAARDIKRRGGAKLIAITNVFNHIDDLVPFMKNVRRALRPDGVFVIEVPYGGTLVDQLSFDTIYLEHTSYFFIKPLRRLFNLFGFKIISFTLNDYMGGSVRLYVSVYGKESPEVKKILAEEEVRGYFKRETYRTFMQKLAEFKMDLMAKLYAVKAENGKIIGIGAATKGNTLLNYCGVDSTLLDYVTDASPLKIGKYTPGSHIEIRDDTDIGKDITHGVILPWNIGGFLKKKLGHLGIEFIVPHMEQ